jgi:hypothetical protein
VLLLEAFGDRRSSSMQRRLFCVSRMRLQTNEELHFCAVHRRSSWPATHPLQCTTA